MGRHYRIDIEGTPIPQGSMRCFRGRITHANRKLKLWRKTVVEAVVGEVKETLQGPIYLYAIFVMPRPKTCSRVWPVVRPDCDKLIRAIGDALVDAGAVGDDAQIVEIYTIKRYPRDGETPGAILFIQEIDGG